VVIRLKGVQCTKSVPTEFTIVFYFSFYFLYLFSISSCAEIILHPQNTSRVQTQHQVTMGFDVDTVLSKLKQNEKIALLSGEISDLDTMKIPTNE
jgi:hypothetical protein